MTIAPNDGGILYSPYNWNIDSSRAATVNAGAYLRTLLVGTPTAVSLTFDLTGAGSPLPQISYRIDQGSWQSTTIAASVTLTLPGGNAWTKHLLEVVVKSTATTLERWTNPATMVRLTGIVTTPSTVTAQLPIRRALNLVVFGDSITEGLYTLNTSGVDVNISDAAQGWAFALGGAVGAEVGVVGWGYQGFTHLGAGNVPVFGSTWPFLWSGVARSFSPTPDLVIINQGVNDGAASASTFTLDYRAVLEAMLSTLPQSVRVMILQPFGFSASSNIAKTAAVADGISQPSRVGYVNTAGWLSSSDAGDGLHPYGYINLVKLAPLVATASRALLGRGSQYVQKNGVFTPLSVVRM